MQRQEKESVPFARSNIGQFYLDFSLLTGLNLRQLGNLRRKDPELYEFLEEAYVERVRRLRKSMEG